MSLFKYFLLWTTTYSNFLFLWYFLLDNIIQYLDFSPLKLKSFCLLAFACSFLFILISQYCKLLMLLSESLGNKTYIRHLYFCNFYNNLYHNVYLNSGVISLHIICEYLFTHTYTLSLVMLLTVSYWLSLFLILVSNKFSQGRDLQEFVDGLLTLYTSWTFVFHSSLWFENVAKV